MDPNVIREWCTFCQGEKEFDRYHFSTLFMELFLEPLRTEDVDHLRTIFRYIPNSELTLEMMLRMDGRAEDRTDEQILDLVKRDLKQMRKVLDLDDGLDEVIGVIEADAYSITLDEVEFDEARSSNLNGRFHHCIAGFVMRRLAQCDKTIAALSEAFYGLAGNSQLQSALTAELMRLDIDFSNYFELYLVGVDYALCDDHTVIMNYRATMESESE